MRQPRVKAEAQALLTAHSRPVGGLPPNVKRALISRAAGPQDRRQGYETKGHSSNPVGRAPLSALPCPNLPLSSGAWPDRSTRRFRCWHALAGSWTAIAVSSVSHFERRPTAARAGGTSSPGHPRMRVCVLCGESLEGRRRDARFCGGPCRAEASRLRAILRGSEAVPYSSVEERLQARRRGAGPSGRAGPNVR